MPPTLTTYNQSVTINRSGFAELTGSIGILGYQKVCLAIVPFPLTPAVAPSILVNVTMGKLSQWTLAQVIERFPSTNNGQIHVSDVIGPEMSVGL